MEDLAAALGGREEAARLIMASVDNVSKELAASKANYDEALDTIWMMLASMLVFFMHAGFSMLEAGCVRKKNTQAILSKNLIVVTVGFLCWYFLGFPLALAPTENPNRFTGGTNFAMDGFFEAQSNFRIWFFQGAFCATGGTIVSGAMAERTQLRGFGIFVIAMTSVIYPMIVYWGWSGEGFLYYKDGDESVSVFGPPLADFAGSGIVHLAGGVGALVGATVVGPRKDRWDAPNEQEFNGNSIPFCVLGTFFLWFGWYGFNPGSTQSMKTTDDAFSAGLVACNTTLAPCVAGLVVFFLRAYVFEPKMLDVGGFCNGILAGLVSITAGCASVRPWEAIIIGFIGGCIYQGCSALLKRLKVDDVVDAIPVHGACGLWGLLALGFFGDPAVGGNGAFYGGNQIGTQLMAALIITAWVGTLSFATFYPLKQSGFLRLADNIQDLGADKIEFGVKTEREAPASEEIVV